MADKERWQERQQRRGSFESERDRDESRRQQRTTGAPYGSGAYDNDRSGGNGERSDREREYPYEDNSGHQRRDFGSHYGRYPSGGSGGGYGGEGGGPTQRGAGGGFGRPSGYGGSAGYGGYGGEGEPSRGDNTGDYAGDYGEYGRPGARGSRSSYGGNRQGSYEDWTLQSQRGSSAGAYGEQRSGHDQDRDFWDRAGDEVSSWLGDDDARRRRDRDHRGRGPRGYQRSDERIAEDVSDRLTDDPHIDPSEIEVTVSTSEVTLSGTVTSRDQKRRAEDCAEAVSGVTHVQNNLRVQSQSTTGQTDTSQSQSE